MYSKLILIGNLGKDPEIRFTPEGNPVATINVATSYFYKDKDETTWFRVTVWGKQAEKCGKYLKGSKVLVEGRLTADDKGNPRVFERKDGTWAASYEVTADNVRFLSGKAEVVE